MTLILASDFYRFGVTGNPDSVHDRTIAPLGNPSYSLAHSQGGATGGFRYGDDLDSTMTITGLGITTGSLIWGFSARIIDSGNQGENYWYVRDSANNEIARCLWSSGNGGVLIFYDANNVLIPGLESVAVGFGDTDWNFVEVKMSVGTGGSTGSLVIRVNGVEVENVTGIDFDDGNANLDEIQFGANDGSGLDQWWMQDLYVADSAGSYNNDFLGKPDFEFISPTGDGNTTAWTLSTGVDHYAVVDDATVATADYATGDTEGDIELYTFPTASGGDNIQAVQLLGYFTLPDGGTRYVRPVIRKGGVNYTPLASRAVPDGGFLEFSIEEDPATTAAWTTAGVNACEFGWEIRDS